MSHIIVVGGGLIGLATGLMLVKSGHEITVLERDQAPPPRNAQEAWGDWERNGVGQFRQPHYLLPRGRQILDAQLPAVTQALIDADAAWYNPVTVMPPGITDRSSRPADEQFTAINARRPVLEYTVASMARDTLDVRRGVHVTGLLSDRPGHVSGVRTAGSGDLRADLVIDATGRRSPLPVWLAAIGAGQPAEETSQTPIAYYSRFFQAPAGEQPPPFRAPITTRFDGYTLIVLPGDAGSWSVMIALSAHDQALKALREEANWAKLVSSCPLHENLIAGPPITGVVASGGNADRLRSLVVDAKPVATGILLVGDSWATTNPAVARGITLGLMHAAITAEAVGEHLADPYSLALEHDRLTRERLLPWYRGTVALDRQIFDQFTAVIEGRRPTRPGDPDGAIMRDLVFGLGRDPDIFRAYLEVISMLAQPQEIAARPGMAERIREAAAGGAPAAPPGPPRAEVLAMLS